MNYYDEEFYHEPSEFEMMMDEFKGKLMDAVKEEYISEMDRLRKENEELQDVKKNFEQIKNDYKNKERQLEYHKSELERKVRYERLSNLMKDMEVIMYKATTSYTKLPKCDKCDRQRRVQYTTPLGKVAYENCDCDKSIVSYVPEEYICSEFKINRDRNSMNAWYKPLKAYKDNEDESYGYVSSTYNETTYNSTMKYENLDRYRVLFKTKEECQGYCDYLNSKNE